MVSHFSAGLSRNIIQRQIHDHYLQEAQWSPAKKYR